MRHRQVAMRGNSKRHVNEQGRAEVEKSKTSNDDSNLVRGAVMARGGEEIKEETKKPKLKCLSQCNVDVQNLECELIENDPTFEVTSSQQSGDAAGLEDAPTREAEVLH